MAAGAVVVGGTLVVTESPAEAHEPGTCRLLHIDISRGALPPFLDLCPLG